MKTKQYYNKIIPNPNINQVLAGMDPRKSFFAWDEWVDFQKWVNSSLLDFFGPNMSDQFNNWSADVNGNLIAENRWFSINE
jgi:hypothetical protein